MFSRTKRLREENSDRPNVNADPSQTPEPDAIPESSSAGEGIVSPQMPVVSGPASQTPITIAPQSTDHAKKKIVIAEGATIKGDILGCEYLVIEGAAYASIDLCDKLEVAQNGTFKGTASVSNAEISGYCDGTLVVKDTLHVRSTGHIVGSVQYGQLQVDKGGRIEGEMKIPGKDKNNNETQSESRIGNLRWLDLSEKLSSLSS